MGKTVLLKEKYTEIYVEDGSSILYAKWSGFLKPEEVRHGCSFMTEYIKKHRTMYHISNHIELKVLTKEVQDYLTQEWFPEVEKIGMRKICALVSKDVFAKATVDKVNEAGTMGNLSIMTLGSMEDCLVWLNE